MKSVWRFPPFLLDPGRRRLTRDGVAVSLQPKAFDVLLVLIENAGDLISREHLFSHVWRDAHVEDANLTNSIAALRRVLGPDAIETSHKFGYRFRLAVKAESAGSAVAAEFLREAQIAIGKRKQEGLAEAKNLLWLAIAEDPHLAEAWAWLARACRFLEKNGVKDGENRRMAEAAFRRAFLLDPDLATAHQFYTAFQVDRGESVDALQRLLSRVRKNPEDVHSYVGLVQVCRFCGLLEASLEAHERAMGLDPHIGTSVAHTHFARCDYMTVVDSYKVPGKHPRGYLDLAAWAVLQAQDQIEARIAERLVSHGMPPLFEALMQSLLAAVRGDTAGVERIARTYDFQEDPESAYYFARHAARCGASEPAMKLLDQMIQGGLLLPVALQKDPWLASVRSHPRFQRVLEEAVERQRHAELVFQTAGGPELLK